MKKECKEAKQGKKGFTLSEICIVLALVAIVSSIVTSFCLVIHQRSVISRARLDIVNEVNVLEAYAERWVDKMSEKNAVFEEPVLDENGNPLESIKLKANVTTGEDACYIQFEDGVFVGTLFGEEPMTYTTTRIASMDFDVQEKNGDYIFFCTTRALLPQVNGEDKVEEYTFCINSRVGEIYD